MGTHDDPRAGRDEAPAADDAGSVEVRRSEEELRTFVGEREYGSARLRTRIEREHVSQRVPIEADVVDVVEIRVDDPEADSGQVEETAEGVSVPVFEERLVVERRLVVARRVLLRRTRRVVDEQTVSAELRRQRVEVEIDRPSAELEREALDLAGEDLSRGPTPQREHSEGGIDNQRDTAQGPTPQTRQVMRATEGEAAGDRPSRRRGGGTQEPLEPDPVRRTDVASDRKTPPADAGDHLRP